MPLAAAVAAHTVLEVLDAEGALVVVATDAALRGGRRVVHERLRRADLSALRRAGAHLVAVGAGEALARVRRVGEADAVGARRSLKNRPVRPVWSWTEPGGRRILKGIPGYFRGFGGRSGDVSTAAAGVPDFSVAS